MQYVIKKINILKLFWRAINDLIGYRGRRIELEFPETIGEYSFSRVILAEKKNNKFQYAIYSDKNGKEYIAKQLPLKSPGIDEYWLRNEINIYSILKRVQEKNTELLAVKFPDINIPKIIFVLSDEVRLLCLMEKVAGKSLFEIPVNEAVLHIEKALDYMRFLNSIHDFKKETMVRRGFLKMPFILTLVVLGALIRHPEEYRKILKGLLFITKNSIFLLMQKKRSLVHRDISQENILMSPDEKDYIIDFELSSYTHPMWEIVHTAVDCRRRAGFLDAFNKTLTMKEIFEDAKKLKLYKTLSVFCGIHLLSTASRSAEQAIDDKKYLNYALNLDVADLRRQIGLFSHIYLVLKLKLVKLFREIQSDTTLPELYGDYHLIKTLKDFPCGIGVYKNNRGEKILLKTWNGSAQTYEYNQLYKEVRLYELLQNVVERIGTSVEEKYRKVRIPRILEKKVSAHSITAAFEYIEESKHLSDVQSVPEKTRMYDLATGYWRFLGSHLTSAERRQLPQRGFSATLLTYLVVFLYALVRFPKRFFAILRTVPIIFRAIPYLYSSWRNELVHRDFHFENVLANNDKVTIIDFGDNALTHPLQIFTNSLHWEWDNAESRKIILNSIISFYGRSIKTERIFRALFAISAVQLLHDTDSENRLELNFRCFDGVVYHWDKISSVLSGVNVSDNGTTTKPSVKNKIIRFLQKVRAPIVRFLKPLSKYVLIGRGPSLEPLSVKYGFDRGTPIDRYYIDKFLNKNKELIYGRCLEIHDNFYTIKFGGKNVTKSDVLDFNTENKDATIYGDLKNISHVEDNSFDCIILTQTLGMIDDCQSAVRECYRILKPGGNLLFTSKAMGPVFDEEESYWKFTKAGVRYLFGLSFSDYNLKINSYGNVLSGQAFWVGASTEELTKEELDHSDSRYEIIITAVAKK